MGGGGSGVCLCMEVCVCREGVSFRFSFAMRCQRNFAKTKRNMCLRKGNFSPKIQLARNKKKLYFGGILSMIGILRFGQHQEVRLGSNFRVADIAILGLLGGTDPEIKAP